MAIRCHIQSCAVLAYKGRSGGLFGAFLVRFALILLALAVLGLAALFVYGQMLEPDTTTIVEEAPIAQ